MEKRLLSLSVIIVTWNGDELLRGCLESLRAACGIAIEIVVVDNANLESTRDVVLRFENAKYVATEMNLGFAGGNNFGLKYCSRPYILLLNNDTIVHQQPFSTMIAYLKDHPDIAVVQGRMNLPLMGNVLDACGIMMSRCGILMDRDGHKSSTSSIPSSYVLAAKGACLLFDRNVLNDVGGLFHGHFFNNHEETDFCHRVWLSGRKVAYVDTPAIDHLCNQTVRQIRRVEFEAQSLSNHLFSYLTLFGLRGLLTVLPLFVLLQGLVALSFLLRGQTLYCRILVGAICRLWRRRKLVAQVRRNIQASRRITDSELFKIIMPHNSWSYVWLWLRGCPEEFWR